jgi:hypothetical protein
MGRRRTACTLATGFSLREKLYAQATFQVTVLTGIIGIVRADPVWVVPYVVLYGYLLPGVVMRHLLCTRCPHLHVYYDCLQFPPSWARRLVKRRKATRLSVRERWLVAVVMVAFVVYPLLWLRSQPLLFAVFATSALSWYLGQRLSFCRRCRSTSCPFNQVPRHLRPAVDRGDAPAPAPSR